MTSGPVELKREMLARIRGSSGVVRCLAITERSGQRKQRAARGHTAIVRQQSGCSEILLSLHFNI